MVLACTIAGKPPPSLADLRANFAPAGTLRPVPKEVSVSSVVVGAAPAHWLAPPGVKSDRVLLFLHGGGDSSPSLFHYAGRGSTTSLFDGCQQAQNANRVLVKCKGSDIRLDAAQNNHPTNMPNVGIGLRPIV